MNITDDMLTEIARLWDEGWDYHAISRKLGVNRGTVTNKVNLMTRSGDTRITRGRIDWDDDDSLFVLQQRENEKQTFESIGRALNKRGDIVSAHYRAIIRDLEASEA